MITAETRLFAVGRFTVQQRPRFDNPAFAVYVVFLGEKLVGKNFSMPSESDCEWLLRSNGETYATKSVWHETSEGRPIWNAPAKRRPGRPRKDEALRRQAEEEAIAF